MTRPFAVGSGFDHAQHLAEPLAGRLAATPLRSHARYSREKILAGLDYAHLKRLPNSFQQGAFQAVTRACNRARDRIRS